MKYQLSKLYLIAAMSFVTANQAHAASYIGGLDGSSISSTFEVGGDTNVLLPFAGWTALSGSARVFDPMGLNGALINSSDPYANYAVQYRTGTLVQANTAYQLNIDMGFYSGKTGGNARYTAELGTLSSTNLFTPLTTVGDIVFYAGNLGQGTISGQLNFTYTTLATVSNEELAVRWQQITSAGQTNNNLADYFGIDNVTLSAQTQSQPGTVPEPTTLALMGLGFAGMSHFRRRKTQA